MDNQQQPIIFTIVQGDTFNFHVAITVDDELIDPSYIQSVSCTCQEMNYIQQLAYDESIKEYVYSLTAEQTATFYVGNLSFYVDIIFMDGTTKTAVYQGFFRVLQRGGSVWTTT